MKTFYVIVVAQALSILGSQISGLAVSIWVLKETGNVTPLTLVSVFVIVPQLLAAGFGGMLADRFDRRLVMIASDAGAAMGTVLLLLSFMSGAFELWHLYAISFFQALCHVFYGPAFQAAITMLVPDARRDRANALAQIAGPMSGVIAPALAGMIYAAVGVVGAFLIDLATFAAATTVMLFVRIPNAHESSEGRAMRGSPWREAFAGLAYLASRPPMIALSVWGAAINFVLGISFVLTIPYVLARTGSEATMGAVMAAFNLGGVVGGLTMGAWGGTRPRIHTVMLGAALASLALVAAGVALSPLRIAAALFFVMFAVPFAGAASASIFQAKVAPDVQGRVFAAVGQMNMLALPIAYLIAGPLADRALEPLVGTPHWGLVAPVVGDADGAGIGLILVVCGLVAGALTAATYAVPMIRNIERDLPDHSV